MTRKRVGRLPARLPDDRSSAPSSSLSTERAAETHYAFRSSLQIAAIIRRLDQADAFPLPVYNPQPDLAKLAQSYTIQDYITESATSLSNQTLSNQTLSNQIKPLKQEANAAMQVVRHILERLRRLPSAYGEWPTFDAAAYFDLTTAQSQWLFSLHERFSSVQAVFYVEPLLPSFQKLAQFVMAEWVPAYRRARLEPEKFAQFLQEIQPNALMRWQQAQQVLALTRQLLADDADFWALNAATMMRWQWHEAWEQPAAPLLARQWPASPSSILSLTLAREFPLPAWRQPERRQRLWRNREYKK